MEYLKIRRTKSQVRADGSQYAVPVFISKTRKYGKVTSEQSISIKQSVLVTGAHDSGKTRWMTRLHEHAQEIWGAKHKAEPLYLDSLSPLSAWTDSPALGQWWDARQAELPEADRDPWKSLKQHNRADALPDYCLDNKAVLFIDDAHKLTGRKLQLARQCAMNCRLWIVAKLPLYSASEISREKEREYKRRMDVAGNVANFITAIASRNHAVRELALYRSLEARSAIRVQQGIVEVAEQVQYLEKVAGAQESLINDEAKIMENRLKLAGMCDPVNAATINAWLTKVSAVPGRKNR